MKLLKFFCWQMEGIYVSVPQARYWDQRWNRSASWWLSWHSRRHVWVWEIRGCFPNMNVWSVFNWHVHNICGSEIAAQCFSTGVVKSSFKLLCCTLSHDHSFVNASHDEKYLVCIWNIVQIVHYLAALRSHHNPSLTCNTCALMWASTCGLFLICPFTFSCWA